MKSTALTYYQVLFSDEDNIDLLLKRLTELNLQNTIIERVARNLAVQSS